eukprot:s185_g18.t1
MCTARPPSRNALSLGGSLRKKAKEESRRISEGIFSAARIPILRVHQGTPGENIKPACHQPQLTTRSLPTVQKLLLLASLGPAPATNLAARHGCSAVQFVWNSSCEVCEEMPQPKVFFIDDKSLMWSINNVT